MAGQTVQWVRRLGTSPGTAASLLPLSVPPLALGRGEPWALEGPGGGGKDTAAFALCSEAAAAPRRVRRPEGGSAPVAAAGAWPPPPDRDVYA